LKGDPEPIANEDKLAADIAAAQARLYGDDPGDAERRLAALTAMAPANPSLHADLAAVYDARGWPRRAAEELRIARAQRPHDADIETAAAENQLERREWSSAATAAEDLATRFPEALSVQRLRRAVELHDRRELEISADNAFRSATSVAGGGGQAVEARLYSAPIASNWRVFGSERFGSQRIPEGRAVASVTGAGLEYRGPDLTVTTSAGVASFAGTHRPAVDIAADWALDDHWGLAGEAAAFSPDTPLRALKHGITADGGSISLAWRDSESRNARVAGEGLRFSDGNTRLSLAGQWQERLLAMPHFRLTGIVDLATSSNTRGDAPYFNPRHDLLGSAGLAAEQILHRRYEFTWSHGAAVSAGAYLEQGFGIGPVFSLHYEHRLRHDDFEGALGITFAHQPFDGRPENSLAVTFKLDWKF
jgi:biofilm PGA synthesis protein PgaA